MIAVEGQWTELERPGGQGEGRSERERSLGSGS